MLLKRLLLCSLSCFVFVSSLKISSHANEANLDENTYAVICESNSSPLIINASDVDIDGLMYSNCDIIATTAQINQRDNYQCDYYVENFSYQLMNFDGKVANYGTDYCYTGEVISVNTFGLFDIEANCHTLSVDEIFGANDTVMINAAVVDSSEKNGRAVIFSSNESITINAGVVDFDGVIYAPNGSVEINADNVDIHGIIIANDLIINCNSCTLSANNELFNEYDIKFYTLGSSDVGFDIMAASGSDNDSWYYNTGTSVVERASYSEYNLLTTVKRGDIIHENRSFSPSQIVGHIACVEGIYYMPLYGSGSSSSTYKYNIRLIEAIDVGVCRSILDDTRCDDNDVVLLRYDDTISSADMSRIMYFLQGQLGKPYKLETSRSSSYNASNWYCSELVWAAYNYIGLDIEDGDFGLITPGDIKDCDNTATISYK